MSGVSVRVYCVSVWIPQGIDRMSSYYMFGWIQSVPPIICDCCWPPRDDTSFNRQQLHILLYWSVTLNTSFRGFQKKNSSYFFGHSCSIYWYATTRILMLRENFGRLFWMYTRFDKVSSSTIEAILHWMLTQTPIAFGQLQPFVAKPEWVKWVLGFCRICTVLYLTQNVLQWCFFLQEYKKNPFVYFQG